MLIGHLHSKILATGPSLRSADPLQGFSKNPRHSLKKYEVWVQNLILFLPHWVCACMLTLFSHVQLFATLWTVACQAHCPWDSPGKNTGVGWHFLLQGIFLTQGIKPASPVSPALQADSLPLSHQGSPEVAEGNIFIYFSQQVFREHPLHAKS